MYRRNRDVGERKSVCGRAERRRIWKVIYVGVQLRSRCADDDFLGIGLAAVWSTNLDDVPSSIDLSTDGGRMNWNSQ